MGKNGGLRLIQQHTLDHVFLVSHPFPPGLNASGSSISLLGLDVSHSGEALYIYRRILQCHQFPYTHLVVDIGANDGFMLSNSMNFIQWGWDAILVEPSPSQIEMAKKSTERSVHPKAGIRMNILKKLLKVTNGTKGCHYLLAVFGTLLLLNLMMFNMAVYKGYSTIQGMLGPITNLDETHSLNEALGEIEVARNALAMGKNGGLRLIQQHTIDRLFLVSHPFPPGLNASGSSISLLGLDVSHSGEALYIYRRILQRRQFPYAHLVVDIGANDGFLASNSMNFIQWGWDAILVEPSPSQIEMAKKNNERYIDPYKDGHQQVHFEQAVISDLDGTVELAITKDLSSQQNHIVRKSTRDSTVIKGDNTIEVPSLSVKTFTQKYHIPKFFGILSIDAEGVGDKILHQWIDLGFRPAYIIYEGMHTEEPLDKTEAYLHSVDYTFLITLDWNNLYELRPQGRQPMKADNPPSVSL